MIKKIITDCDGVLLDWAFAFDVWMSEQGYEKTPNSFNEYQQTLRYGISEEEALNCVKRFNESGAVGFLPPFRDSQEYVKKLALQGWKFDVVSSLHIDKYAQKLRAENLKHLFGDVFDHIDCSLDFTKSKLSYLKNRYENTNFYWIEDSISHATSGQQIGLKSIIMDHSYNKNWNGMRVKNWKEIYEVVNDNSTQ